MGPGRRDSPSSAGGGVGDEGAAASKSEEYTPEIARVVARAICTSRCDVSHKNLSAVVGEITASDSNLDLSLNLNS